MMNVKSIAPSVIALWETVFPVRITMTTVVIAPGPVIKGVASGNTDTSARPEASLISSGVMLSRDVFA